LRERERERERETNRQTNCVPVLGLYACECVYKRTEVVGGQWKGLKEGGAVIFEKWRRRLLMHMGRTSLSDQFCQLVHHFVSLWDPVHPSLHNSCPILVKYILCETPPLPLSLLSTIIAFYFSQLKLGSFSCFISYFSIQNVIYIISA
jgi:hypothetical protein